MLSEELKENPQVCLSRERLTFSAPRHRWPLPHCGGIPRLREHPWNCSMEFAKVVTSSFVMRSRSKYGKTNTIQNYSASSVCLNKGECVFKLVWSLPHARVNQSRYAVFEVMVYFPRLCKTDQCHCRWCDVHKCVVECSGQLYRYSYR